jgi:carbamate kinase
MGWTVVKDAGRGWRRVVPSPLPKEIVELDTIETLIKRGIVVIAVGGGGIPVVDIGDGEYRGIAAVIDKDYACGLLAQRLHADLLLIATAVEKVAINFGRPNQKWLDRMTLAEARMYLSGGDHFAKGSMAPKIEAIIRFLDAGGEEALITNPGNIERALKGETGTRFTRQ